MKQEAHAGSTRTSSQHRAGEAGVTPEGRVCMLITTLNDDHTNSQIHSSILAMIRNVETRSIRFVLVNVKFKQDKNKEMH